MSNPVKETGQQKERRAKEGSGGKKGDVVKVDCGIEVKELYTPDDLKDRDYSKDVGLPGEYPYIRGIHRSK